MKEILVEEYSHYYNDYKFEIIQILKSQGKHKIAKQLIYKKNTLANIIMSEDYYATNLDIWLLAIHFNLPVIFFSATELIENNEKFFVAYSVKDKGQDVDSFYFIKTPGIKNDIPNSYRLVAAPKYNDKLPLTALKPDFAENIKESIKAKDNELVEYLNSVSLLEVTQRLKAKKLSLLTTEAGEEVVAAEQPVKGKKTKKKIVLME